MSEQILKAIIQLLAIVAKEDDLTKDDKKAIEDFLLESVSHEDAKRYMKLFKQLVDESIASAADEISRINEICDKINAEQTIQKKTIVILDLIELIAADKHISDRENELVYHISDRLNIDKKRTDLIKALSKTKKSL